MRGVKILRREQRWITIADVPFNRPHEQTGQRGENPLCPVPFSNDTNQGRVVGRCGLVVDHVDRFASAEIFHKTVVAADVENVEVRAFIPGGLQQFEVIIEAEFDDLPHPAASCLFCSFAGVSSSCSSERSDSERVLYRVYRSLCNHRPRPRLFTLSVCPGFGS